VSLDGEILRRQIASTDEATAAWRTHIRESVTEFERDLGQAVAIGLGAPGLAARDGRSIAWMQGRMSAIQGLNWTRELALGREISVLNDAHAALLGEAWIGAAAGASNVFMLTLGTGVGGAAIVDGHLLRGAIGRAGHLGHISLNPSAPADIVGTPGSLEDLAGECTLAARSGGRFQTTRALLEAAHSGDASAQAIWDDSVRAIAAGIASLVNVLDPDTVVLGGGIANAGDSLLVPLRAHLESMEWRPLGSGVQIVTATLGEWAGAVGAARNAMNLQAAISACK
jgi:glucokinase